LRDDSRIPLDTIKEICKQSKMWELDNPRVIGMVNNILLCLENEENLDDESRVILMNIVISNLIIFSKYKIV
tara:strand:- start:130 stop:345 length:216 start_codon:yes stop_codon:yes gene_type:complete